MAANKTSNAKQYTVLNILEITVALIDRVICIKITYNKRHKTGINRHG